jgi:hypothetical protein
MLIKSICIAGIALCLSINLPVVAGSSLPRPINPSSRPSFPESDLDRFFRIAFDAATAADFDTAIINYRRAANIAQDECDRQHAEAGAQAAMETKRKREAGVTSLLTQMFARRLEELALPLPCTTQR